MVKKNSKDAMEDNASVKEKKKGKKGKKEKKPKLTPEEKAIKKKEKVEKQSASTIKKAQDRVKKAEQAIKNKEKSAAKKEKDKEKKETNKIKSEEKKIENKIKKKENKKEKKIESKERKRELKIENRAEKAQRKAELAARTPIQRKIDRHMAIRKLLIKLIVLIVLVALILAGVKFGPALIEKLDLPKINVSETLETIKSKIPFLNKEKPAEEKKDAKKDEKAAAEKKPEATTTPEAVEADDVTLYISGTSVLEPFYTEALADFLKIKKKDAKVQSTVLSTNEAYTNLINGDQQVIFSTFPTDKETKMAELAGVDLQPIPILNGGFVFFINENNPVKNLTETQLYNIYAGTITNWKELGGKDEPIVAYQRSDNSGSQTGIYKYVISEEEIVKVGKEMKVAETKEIVKDISENSGAIGYSYYYYMEELKEKNGVKMIGVNGVAPNKKTIANGKYPLTTYSYAIITTEEKTKSLSDIISSVDNKIDEINNVAPTPAATDAEAATPAAVEAPKEELTLKMKFVKWILSEKGQALAEEKGFIRHDDQ